MFKNVKVGDRLYSVEDGYGVVEIISMCRVYPLTIRFDCCRKSFTLTGRRYAGSKNPILFWDKIEFEIPKRQLPYLKVDTKVIVWNSGDDVKKKRHFKEFNKDGVITCFVHGTTSWTSNTSSAWEYWEIAE